MHPTNTLFDLDQTDHPATGISLHDASLMVQEWTDLTVKRRAALRSALASVARLAGLPPADVPLTPGALRATVLNRSAASLGITRGSLHNMLSSVRCVARRLGIIDTGKAPLTEQWQRLLDRLIAQGGKRLQKSSLMGFARFCSAHGIVPEAVCTATFLAYEDYLATRTLTTKARKRMGGIRRAWNAAAQSLPDWPAPPVPPPVTPHPYIRPLDDFTPAFRRSLEAFRRHLTADILYDPIDVFAPEAPTGTDAPGPVPLSKPLRAISAAQRIDHARWAASAAVATGTPIEAINDITDLVRPVERCQAILRHVHACAGKQASAAGAQLGGLLMMVARHHARLDAAGLARIKHWKSVVTLTYEGLTEKNERTVSAAMNPARELLLLNLPATLMARAETLFPDKPKAAAGVALRAVAIEILNTLPIRLSNLCHLRLDRHLHRSDPRRGLITAIRIPPEETKNSRAITMPVSRRTGQLLEVWIKRYRPHRAMPGSPYLFPGQNKPDKPISSQAMRDAVKQVTGDHVGVVLSPHQFRHLAAHRLLAEYPRAYEDARRLLGHTSIATTVRHYSGTESESAARLFDELNTRRATALRRKPAAAPKRGKPAKAAAGVSTGARRSRPGTTRREGE